MTVPETLSEGSGGGSIVVLCLSTGRPPTPEQKKPVRKVVAEVCRSDLLSWSSVLPCPRSDAGGIGQEKVFVFATAQSLF